MVHRFGILGAVFLATACGAKEHPAALTDDKPLPIPMHEAGADVFTSGTDEDGAVLGGGDAAAGDSGVNGGAGNDPLAIWLKQHCEKPPYGTLLCYYPEKGHPSETAVFRNMDTRNGVFFSWGKDPSHATFETMAGYQGHVWHVKLSAPTGKEIVAGQYSTDANDGTTFTFTWDEGACPGKESATFEVFGVTWDDMGVTTRMEFDFKHHCGEMTAPMAEGRYRLNSSLPL
jgi:hypothetical protein